MTEAEAVLEELDTLRQKLAHLKLKYESEYPDLLQDYTLAMQRRRALLLKEDWTESFRVDWQEAP